MVPNSPDRRTPAARRAPIPGAAVRRGASARGRRAGRRPAVAAAVALAALVACGPRGGAPAHTDLRFSVSYPEAAGDSAVDGRLLVLLSADTTSEPRFRVDASPDRSAQVFGLDVGGLAPGGRATLGDTVTGFPVARMADLPPGDYRVQAVLNRYETFHLASGDTVELPPDRGEGQDWSRKPGNLYSVPKTVRVDPSEGGTVRLSLDSVIPDIAPPEDTHWVRHLRIRSDLLTAFWGRPTYLQATVLVPRGFAEHPGARFPLLVEQGHFGRGIPGWRPEPPDTSLPAPDTAWLWAHCPTGREAGCEEHGMRRERQRLEHAFYRWWAGPDAPRALLMTIQHANPYYDDSYAVNSANLGPYGDAIARELIPAVEREFRGIGAGWSRVTFGGSTGGWEALGVQVFYPDVYAGAWGFCPDPLDFHAYQAVDVYAGGNAYRRSGPFGSVAVPGARDHTGRVRYQMADENHMEMVLGSRGRSGGQWDIWQAVFGPRAEDGYPKPIWDKETGAIDTAVASYWREHYDLASIVRRDWDALGPKLRGKLHVYVGTMDSYYLNDGVRLFQDVVEGLTDPPADATFEYGRLAEHCWTGDHDHPNWAASATVVPRFMEEWVREMASRAPRGADTKSWRY